MAVHRPRHAAPARLLLPADRSELVGKKPETAAGADELGAPALDATAPPDRGGLRGTAPPIPIAKPRDFGSKRARSHTSDRRLTISARLDLSGANA